MERAGIGSATLGWPGLGWARLGSAALGPAGLVSSRQARLDEAEIAELSCARQEQTQLGWVRLCCLFQLGFVWNWLLLLVWHERTFLGKARLGCPGKIQLQWVRLGLAGFDSAELGTTGLVLVGLG